jgi:probable addiction module antidote protein
MALKTTLWDPSEYLESPESIAAYLEAAFEDGDPSLIAAALGDIARAMGMTQLAAKAGVTREALYKALSPTGDPRLSTFLGVMKALGWVPHPSPFFRRRVGGPCSPRSRRLASSAGNPGSHLNTPFCIN